MEEAMIDRLANALREYWLEKYNLTVVVEGIDVPMDIARLVLRTIKNPTDRMQSEGNDRYNEMVAKSPIREHEAHRPHIYEAWNRMVDVALEG